nr:MAG TPA: Restriction endonuclease [Caudoviricetes sp.]
MKPEALLLIGALAYIFILLFLRSSIVSQREHNEWTLNKNEATLEKNKETLKEIENQRSALQKELKRKDTVLTEISFRCKYFNQNFLMGRKWLAELMAGYEEAKDRAAEECLRYKSRPAITAANEVSKIKKEKKALLKENVLLKSELETIKEYFPVIEEYEQEILEETNGFLPMDLTDDSGVDRVRRFMSPEEYKKLPTSERNQLALDRFLKHTSQSYVGKLFELQLGWEYEQANYLVEYTGIQDKKKDKGRDLICKEFAGMGDTLIVQAKCWAAKKTIFEKHIFQLFGTVFEYKRKHPGEVVRGVFVTTTKLDDFARECAKELGIEVEENYKLRKDFPMIKCNISSSGEKIYHLPFDQQYDKVKIDRQGEFLALTVKEAEAAGFRRAMRWHGKNN